MTEVATTPSRSPAASSRLSLDQLLDITSQVGVERPLWNPDGTEVAVVSSLGGRPQLWAFPVDGGPAVRLTSQLGEVGHLAWVLARWSPDGHAIAWVAGDIGATEVWLQPTDGTAASQLTHIGANISALEWAPDGQSLVVSANRRGSYDLYRVTLDDPRPQRLTDHDCYEVSPAFTPDGTTLLHVRLDEAWTGHTVVARSLDASTDEVGDERIVVTDKDFFDYHYGRSFGSPVVSPDGATVLFRSYRSNWLTIWSVPLAGGEPRPLVAEAADRAADHDMPAWSPDGRHVVMTENRNADVGLVIVDVETGTTRDLVAAQDQVCAMPSWSPDGTRVAFTMATPTCPPDLHVVDVPSGEMTRLTRSVAPQVQRHLAVPERISYHRDGLDIPAFLFRPEAAGVQPNGAGIVLVHGGPTMQWLPIWEAYAQFLVGRGFAVIAPNIRGSSGYGRAFEEANDGDWCGGDLQDVLMARDVLRDHTGVGPVAVTGVSYGGIMSMAAVSFAPGAFDAAVSLSGYGDFLHMMNEQEFRHQQLLRKELGDPVEDSDVYRKASPLHAVRAATTPAFVAHGVGRYPSSDAGRQFAEALEREYKVVTYRTYADEHYYVTGRENTRRLWGDIDEFLTTHLDLGRPSDGGEST